MSSRPHFVSCSQSAAIFRKATGTVATSWPPNDTRYTCRFRVWAECLGDPDLSAGVVAFSYGTFITNITFGDTWYSIVKWDSNSYSNCYSVPRSPLRAGGPTQTRGGGRTMENDPSQFRGAKNRIRAGTGAPFARRKEQHHILYGNEHVTMTLLLTSGSNHTISL